MTDCSHPRPAITFTLEDFGQGTPDDKIVAPRFSCGACGIRLGRHEPATATSRYLGPWITTDIHRAAAAIYDRGAPPP